MATTTIYSAAGGITAALTITITANPYQAGGIRVSLTPMENVCLFPSSEVITALASVAQDYSDNELHRPPAMDVNIWAEMTYYSSVAPNCPTVYIPGSTELAMYFDDDQFFPMDPYLINGASFGLSAVVDEGTNPYDEQAVEFQILSDGHFYVNGDGESSSNSQEDNVASPGREDRIAASEQEDDADSAEFYSFDTVEHLETAFQYKVAYSDRLSNLATPVTIEASLPDGNIIAHTEFVDSFRGGFDF